MYKVTHLSAINSVRNCQRVGVLCSVGTRFQCINTSTNVSKPKSQFIVYSMGTILTGIFGTAGVVLYSKNDPKFRQLLVTNIPGSEDFLKIFDDKDMLQGVQYLGGRLACKIGQQINVLKKTIIGESNDVFDKSIDKVKLISHNEPISTAKNFKVKENKTEAQELTEPNVKNVENEPILNKPMISKNDPIIVTAVSPQNKEATFTVAPPKNVSLNEIESDILKSTTEGIEAYNLATQLLKEYNDSIFKLIENSTEIIDPNLTEKLEKLEENNNLIYVKMLDDAKKHKKQIIEKQKLLNESKFESSEKLAKVLHTINSSIDKISKADSHLEHELHRLALMKNYKSKISQGQINLIKEFESLFPNLDITQNKNNDMNIDYDLFLLYAMKKLNHFQDILSKNDTLHDQKLNKALHSELFDADSANLLNSRLSVEVDKLDNYFENKLNKLKIKLDEDLQNQLKLHTQAHAELIIEAVEDTKEQIESRVRDELSFIEKLEQEKYKLQLDKLRSDLQKVINNLKERAERDKNVFTHYAMWEVSELIKSSLNSCDSNEPVHLKNKIKDIKISGVTDQMVNKVFDEIPPKALENGVLTKGQLKEDFKQVEKRVYQTALIPDDTFNLPLMAFSYFISLFVVHHSHISASEVNNEEFDPSELNTYEIIERARYCIDRDDFLQTIRYLNLLTGCSRVVAKLWMQEATLFLETKQAFDLLTSYAAATTTPVHST
ncbi:MICOS complex subunit Mic60-like [Daktulosphaira vitifoliae]|uniref:MICOS complex subunit Mic60-like n=1 Tax=Daktulosphaira vitifoliae TaxID=58002 RepID=UPI0021A98746|nr:MICOS complex subunit Mic60-like [Daktulosphaira vitifoliae]